MMMKSLDELTKEELKSLWINIIPQLPIVMKCLECAACGKTSKAKYYYICDSCNESLATTNTNDSFSFLYDEGEDIYTVNDGEPFNRF